MTRQIRHTFSPAVKTSLIHRSKEHNDYLQLGLERINGAIFVNRPRIFAATIKRMNRLRSADSTGIVPAQMIEMNRWLDSKPGKRPKDYVHFKKKISLELQHYIQVARRNE